MFSTVLLGQNSAAHHVWPYLGPNIGQQAPGRPFRPGVPDGPKFLRSGEEAGVVRAFFTQRHARKENLHGDGEGVTGVGYAFDRAGWRFNGVPARLQFTSVTLL